jgi:hypothetical protein
LPFSRSGRTPSSSPNSFHLRSAIRIILGSPG